MSNDDRLANVLETLRSALLSLGSDAASVVTCLDQEDHDVNRDRRYVILDASHYDTALRSLEHITAHRGVFAGRPTWDDTFMALAEVWALRATCPRRSVGAVIVDDGHHVIASGYNGAPRGQGHCLDVGCLMVHGHCQRALHSERNAIIQAARTGISILGTTLYITGFPCLSCAAMLVQVGIREIVYGDGYPLHSDPHQLLSAAGITLRPYPAEAKV